MVSVHRSRAKFTVYNRFILHSKLSATFSKSIYGFFPFVYAAVIPSNILIYTNNIAVFKTYILHWVSRSIGYQSAVITGFKLSVEQLGKGKTVFAIARYLVMDPPDNDRRMIVILLCHFLYHRMGALNEPRDTYHLCAVPHSPYWYLTPEKHSALIEKIHKILGIRIMRTAYGICVHILYYVNIPLHKSLRKCRAKIGMLLVTAYPLHGKLPSVQIYLSSLRLYLAETNAIVKIVCISLNAKCIQLGRIRIPKSDIFKLRSVVKILLFLKCVKKYTVRYRNPVPNCDLHSRGALSAVKILQPHREAELRCS